MLNVFWRKPTFLTALHLLNQNLYFNIIFSGSWASSSLKCTALNYIFSSFSLKLAFPSLGVPGFAFTHGLGTNAESPSIFHLVTNLRAVLALF